MPRFIPRPLRSVGAGLIEYSVLVGLVSSVAVGAVVGLAGSATTPTASASESMVLVAENPTALASDVAPAPDEAAGGVEALTSIATPRSVLFAWSQGEFRPFSGVSASYAPHTSGPSGVSARLDIAALAANVSGLGPYATHPTSGEPFGSASGLRLVPQSGSGFADVVFSEPVDSVSFRVHDLDGEQARPAVFFNGNQVQPAFPGYLDMLAVSGLTADGRSVFPTSGAAFVSDNGNGVFWGYTNRNCVPTQSDCSARFQFDEPIASIVFVFSGGVLDISDIAGTVYRAGQ